LGHFKHFAVQNMIKTDLKILMLEDIELDAELNKVQLLLLEEYNCIVDWVADKASYLESIKSKKYDIILSDYNLPQYNGLEALTDLKATGQLVPFIFVTGTIDEETAAGTIKAGAWDYVVKDRLFRLPLAIRSALQLHEEKKISAKAEKQNQKLLMAIEQSPSHIIINDISGTIEYVNTRFIEVTGYDSEEVIGKKITDFFPEILNNEHSENIYENLKKGTSWKGEILSKKKDGTIFWENLSVSPLRDDDNTITHFVAVKEDITQRKLMEQELISALDRAEQSDKLKNAFLQNLSHEIRTPLNAIVGFSELLNSDPEKSKNEIEEFTNIISKSSHKLLSIVSDVLTMSSIQTGHESINFKLIDINKLFEKLYKIYLPIANRKKIDFIISNDLIGNPIYIRTDETKLDQILTNLVNNAIKFTASGKVELKYLIKGEYIEFYVKDTGIGISKESQAIIFERFRQAEKSISVSYGGTGLGLSISKSFAQMLGGTISVESELNCGSVFCLKLPYKPLEQQFNEISQPKIELISSSLNILIAEDEINNYFLLETLLGGENTTLFHAKNGLEAIEICKNNPSINLVLMDIKMPVMDGIKAFEGIRKIRPFLAIIAQTAYALEQEKQYFINLGFNDYIAKPIIKENLFEKINHVIGSK
jgi:PAS domain S-box-containing protein